VSLLFSWCISTELAPAFYSAEAIEQVIPDRQDDTGSKITKEGKQPAKKGRKQRQEPNEPVGDHRPEQQPSPDADRGPSNKKGRGRPSKSTAAEVGRIAVSFGG
jgi:hypothetical protein